MNKKIDDIFGEFADEQERLARGMKRWDERFMDMARLVSTWSKDPSTKVGAVLIDGHESRRVVSIGYNGFPRGVTDTEERLNERSVKYKLVVHAEANALVQAYGGSIGGCVLYSLKHPCSDCAKLIVQMRLNEVVTYAQGEPSSDERWREDREFARVILREGGVEVREL